MHKKFIITNIAHISITDLENIRTIGIDKAIEKAIVKAIV